ncbi:tripartite motif-containing protein 16-like protein [Astyanax mexicanus]|uniref:tripartite motif-containing protein 16-like protein n=1 Tax=Astyanax mexicanus TaxID=7994 RepID=UPI0020CADBCA|nr:tripartite motif-containing protein 16-like protein [Astyanax mexicanus]
MPTTTRVQPESRKPGRRIKAGNTHSVEKSLVYDANVPEPTTRSELLTHWISLSLDERTANKLLWLTEGGAKVSRMNDEVCPYLDRPERYEHSPQVLCKEGLWGSRGYWEVECWGWVMVGVAYESEGRRNCDGPCGFGENEGSWSLGWSGSSYHIWHKGVNQELVKPQCSTLGVYLDQPAGLICFYSVERAGTGRREVTLLHRVQNPIKEKTLPGFWLGRQSSCRLLPKEE